MSLTVPRHIFRAYDIRGHTQDELTGPVVGALGRAFANVARQRQSKVLIAGDVRLSTESLKTELTEGLLTGGMDVIDIGSVPTPVLYFATHEFNTGCGIMITGSHNPPEFNGLKFMLDGKPFADDSLAQLYTLLNQQSTPQPRGALSQKTILATYMDRIVSDVVLVKPLRIAVDCGNGVTGVLVPQLFEKIGCEVTPLYSALDGTFPNHHPDPVKPQNLTDLIEIVQREHLDLGIAFDGDGDRLGVVSPKGKQVQADVLISYLATSVLAKHPSSTIVLDIKSGRAAMSKIAALGGRLVVCETGHTNVKANLRDSKGKLGGEFSGHICFSDRWYGFDDALYAACRLIETLARDQRNLDDYVQSLDNWLLTPEIEIPTTESRKFEIVENFREQSRFAGATVIDIDGVRVDYEDRWGLLRASNTTPKLSLRFEARSPSTLAQIKNQFAEQLYQVAPDLPRFN